MKSATILSTLSSLTPASFCSFEPNTTWLPPLIEIAPPINDIFSSRITFKPNSLALNAALIPAAPPPTTTKSLLKVTSSPAPLLITVFINASTSPPACCTQSFTAFSNALLELVAPAIVSTPNDWASTIALDKVSIAVVPKPSVSFCFVTSMVSILSSLNVTATSTSPLLPLATAV